MSSKKKPEISQEKKKPSLFSFRNKSNAPTHTKAHKKDDKEETVDLNTASFRTCAKDGTDKPTSSKKATKFFKKTFKRSRFGKAPTSISEEQLQLIQEEKKVSPSSPEIEAPHSVESVKDKPIDVLHEPTDIVGASSHTVPSEVNKKEKAAARIQAIFRGVQARRRYQKQQQSIVKVEAMARGYLARKHVGQMKADAVAEQSGHDHDASNA